MTDRTRPETRGAKRLRRVLETFRETGNITGECQVGGPGTGQAARCFTHGWQGVVQDCEWDPPVGYEGGFEYSHSRCPLWRIASWIERRHALAAEAPL